MDYEKLAAELFDAMGALRRLKAHKDIESALQGAEFILFLIACHDGYVLPSEISQQMNVSTARVASALNTLEKKGLITREIDPKDRRQILVAATQGGKELAEECQNAVQGIAAKMLELLGEHDAREYVRITRRLADLISGCDEFL